MPARCPLKCCSQLTERHREEVERIAAETWGGLVVAVHRELYDLRKLPCLIAISNSGELLGYCYYRFDNSGCEIMALESIRGHIGVGTALVDAVRSIAVDSNCPRLYLQTTNDNIHAFRFYQRRGFTMCAVRWNELDHSRRLKPSIPLVGDEDIPLSHEIELEIKL